MAQLFVQADGTTAINTVLAEEANRIGKDIHAETLHTSPWIDLIKQTNFPDQSGYNLTTLIYDRAIPVSTANTPDATTAGDTDLSVGGGADWTSIAATTGTDSFAGAATHLQNTADAMATENGPTTVNGTSYIHFAKKLRQYNISKAAIESPRIAIEDLRFAAHRADQLRAMMGLLSEATRYTWENRYRDEFERLAGNLVSCTTTGTVIRDTVDGDNDGTSDDSFSGVSLHAGVSHSTLDLADSGASQADISPTANISNAILDKVYYRLVRSGAGNNAYGRENGRPVFALVCSSEASYQLQTEAGFRDDVRYNNAKVSDLIAPLGVEKSFRGFYHLCDDLAPRFTLCTGALTRVLPYTVADGITSLNDTAYEAADYEAAYIIHPDVMESQIPSPLGNTGGISFDPVSYKGDFKWLNIQDAVINPDGTIGFFRGILASASKPIKPDFGYVILFKRTSTTPAA